MRSWGCAGSGPARSGQLSDSYLILGRGPETRRRWRSEKPYVRTICSRSCARPKFGRRMGCHRPRSDTFHVRLGRPASGGATRVRLIELLYLCLLRQHGVKPADYGLRAGQHKLMASPMAQNLRIFFSEPLQVPTPWSITCGHASLPAPARTRTPRSTKYYRGRCRGISWPDKAGKSRVPSECSVAHDARVNCNHAYS